MRNNKNAMLAAMMFGNSGGGGNGLPAIESGDAGKVLTVNNSETGAEWNNAPSELPAIAATDAGKVLKVNSGGTGVEWETPGGGNHLYAHYITFTRNVTGGQMQIYFTIMTNFAAFATITDVYNYLETNLPTPSNVFLSCSGRNTASDDAKIYVGIRATSGEFNIRYIKPDGSFGDQNYVPSWYAFQEYAVQIF